MKRSLSLLLAVILMLASLTVPALAQTSPTAADTTAMQSKATQTLLLTGSQKATMNVGDKLKIQLSGATIAKTATSKSKVATVTEKGTVTAVAEGTAKITVTTSANKKLKLTVTVKDPYKPTGVSFEKSSIELNVGATKKLAPVLAPKGAKTAYTWKSAKTKVATVSSTGVVTAVSEGTAKITVTTANKKKATVTVTVKDPYKPDTVGFGKTSYTVRVGKSITLSPVLTPKTAKTTYTWKSAKTKIASVSSKGVVLGITAGTTKITVTTANKKKATVTINVVPNKIDNIYSKPTSAMISQVSGSWYLLPKSVEIVSSNKVVVEAYLLNGIGKSSKIKNLKMKVYKSGSLFLDGTISSVSASCSKNSSSVVKITFTGSQIKGSTAVDLTSLSKSAIDWYWEGSLVYRK